VNAPIRAVTHHVSPTLSQECAGLPFAWGKSGFCVIRVDL
jgi:hypothetical protein